MNTSFFKNKIPIFLTIALLLLVIPVITYAGPQDNVSGYAYSYMPTATSGANQNYNPNGGTVGQGAGVISLNCTNHSTQNQDDCISGIAGNYGVNINTSSGQFSGTAWSERLGPIDFSGASVSPTCFTNGGSHLISGTIRFTINGGGWDGFVTMSDPARWTDGATLNCNSSTGIAVITGYAWGDTVPGWVQFNATVVFDQNICNDPNALNFGQPLPCIPNNNPPNNNGSCNPITNGQLLSTPPSPGLLCNIGTPSSVNSGSTTWTWTCVGSTGTAQCSATKNICQDSRANNFGLLGTCDFTTFCQNNPTVIPPCPGGSGGGGISPIYQEN